MTTTVQQLIESLNIFPDDSIVKIRSGADDQEYAIADINTIEDKFVTIILSSQDEEDEDDEE